VHDRIRLTGVFDRLDCGVMNGARPSAEALPPHHVHSSSDSCSLSRVSSSVPERSIECATFLAAVFPIGTLITAHRQRCRECVLIRIVTVLSLVRWFALQSVPTAPERHACIRRLFLNSELFALELGLCSRLCSSMMWELFICLLVRSSVD